jgi:hypothetical protein
MEKNKNRAIQKAIKEFLILFSPSFLKKRKLA